MISRKTGQINEHLMQSWLRSWLEIKKTMQVPSIALRQFVSVSEQVFCKLFHSHNMSEAAVLDLELVRFQSHEKVMLWIVVN